MCIFPSKEITHAFHDKYAMTNMPLTHKYVLHIVPSKKAIPYQFSVGILREGLLVKRFEE